MLTNETLTYTSAAGAVTFASYSGAPYFLKRDGVTGIDGLRNDLFSEESAGEDGAMPSGDALLPRAITLAGTLLAADQDAADAHLQRVFNPKRAGTLLYSNGNRQRRIAVRVEQAPTITRGRYRQFFLSLIGDDPYFYEGNGESCTDVATWLPLLEFPLEIPEDGFEFEIRQESQIIDVVNAGDVDIGIRALICATDTLIRPEIMHMGTRERIVLNTTMQRGDVAEVDTRPGSKGIWLTRAGQERQRAFQLRGADMVFWGLSPGDNLIRYDAEAGSQHMTVAIYTACRFVSA